MKPAIVNMSPAEVNSVIPKARGRVHPGQWADTEGIIKEMLRLFNLTKTDLKELAKNFRSDSTETTCKEIWSFIRGNIRYKKDPLGYQHPQEPLALWNSKSGDCKSFSLFAASLLYSLKIPFAFRFVSFDEGDYSHVYVVAVANGQKYIIDSTLPRFNYEDSFTKNLDHMIWLQSIGEPAKSIPAGIIQLKDLSLSQRLEAVARLRRLVQDNAAILEKATSVPLLLQMLEDTRRALQNNDTKAGAAALKKVLAIVAGKGEAVGVPALLAKAAGPVSTALKTASGDLKNQAGKIATDLTGQITNQVTNLVSSLPGKLTELAQQASEWVSSLFGGKSEKVLKKDQQHAVEKSLFAGVLAAMFQHDAFLLRPSKEHPNGLTGWQGDLRNTWRQLVSAKGSGVQEAMQATWEWGERNGMKSMAVWQASDKLFREWTGGIDPYILLVSYMDKGSDTAAVELRGWYESNAWAKEQLTKGYVTEEEAKLAHVAWMLVTPNGPRWFDAALKWKDVAIKTAQAQENAAQQVLAESFSQGADGVKPMTAGFIPEAWKPYVFPLLGASIISYAFIKGVPGFPRT